MNSYIIDKNRNILSKSINKTAVLSEMLKEQKVILEDKNKEEYQSVLDTLGVKYEIKKSDN